MLMRGLFCAALAVAIAAPAVAHADEQAETPKKKKKKKKASGFSVAAEAESRGGMLTGEGTLRQTGGFVRLAGEVTPQLDRDRWRFRAPVSISDR
jgi:hypothetical protein